MVVGGMAGLPCPLREDFPGPGISPRHPTPTARSLPRPRPAMPAPLGPVPVPPLTSAALGRGHRLSPALSVGSAMLDDTAETCAVLRPRSVLGAGGWEFISSVSSNQEAGAASPWVQE